MWRQPPPTSVDLRPSSANVSRRSVTRGAVCALGGAMAGGLLARGRALAASKVPKNQAGYRDAAKGAARCDACVQFQPPASCKLVDGSISPSGSCDFFAPKPH